jgi:uncharacterized membrane protein HdeD (DUF308 family)
MMKRLSSIERTAVVFGLVLVLFGIWMVYQPMEITAFPPGPERLKPILDPNPKPVFVSRSASWILGAATVVVGLGISGLAFYRGRP